MATDWLTTEILAGLQRLSLLRLANSPPTADALEGCARAWLDALAPAKPWADSDRIRVRDAFRSLAQRQPREGQPVYWPAPGDLLALLAPKPAAHQPFPPALRHDTSGSEAGQRALAELVANLPWLQCEDGRASDQAASASQDGAGGDISP